MREFFIAAALIVARGGGGAAAAQPSPAEGAYASDAAVSGLQQRLIEIVAPAQVGESRAAVMVVSLDRGDTLYSANADVPFVPASNMKLFSTAAAFYFLGGDFRFSTYLYATGPIQGDLLSGDLVLYGTGDPTMSSRMLTDPLAPLRAFADSLRALGIRRIGGDLVADGSYFDAQGIGPGWQPNDLSSAYGAPVGALSFAENVVTVRIQPTTAGSIARVTTTPATRGLAVENRVRTVARGTSSVTVSRTETTLVLEGQVRAGATPVVRATPIVDPANYTGAVFSEILAERGIELAGRLRTVRRPTDSTITGGSSLPRLVAVHRSAPLAEIARVTNHVSQNMFAEVLHKTVGRVAVGEGTFEGGGRALARMLERESPLDQEALQLIDGSGLSRTNRVTSRTIIHLLHQMSGDRAQDQYFASLPQAAAPGGLRRMTGTPAAGNLRAKTGTIRNVSALSGYVRSMDGERLAFSIMINGISSTARAKVVEDAVGVALSRFTRQ